MPTRALARFAGQWASDLVDVTGDLSALESAGRWAVAVPYDGTPVCARFARWSPAAAAADVGRWRGPAVDAWESSLPEAEYRAGVEAIRVRIAEGTVYQANLCRVLEAPLPDRLAADVAGLAALLAAGNPAPYAGFLRLPDQRVHIASASPELFVEVRVGDGRRLIRSRPIKGTGRTANDLTDKDAAENVMIVDLVRNDLARVSRAGSVGVPALLAVEEHPGLVHLVSTVEGELVDAVGWPEILAAAFPPGSVTGAPKSSALRVIDELEPVSRGYYTGAFGWVDADAGTGQLAVAIRTFWHDGETVRFGTGAGITWRSDDAAEWGETELKAERLIAVASGRWEGGL